MGQSVGGHLVSLLGTADRAAGFDVGEHLKQSSRLQAVVDEWGPVIFDATLLAKLPGIPEAFGTSDLTELAKYSPLTYITPDDPPFLIVHGAKDTKVPTYQSRDFAAALRDARRLAALDHRGARRARARAGRRRAESDRGAGRRRPSCRSSPRSLRS